MKYLIIVNIIWAFSFSLISNYLAGSIDNYFSILARFSLALIIFLPFIKWNIDNKLKIQLMLIGAIQIGIMYILYYQSFLYLNVTEIALFTIFTPLYINIIYNICIKKFKVLYIFSISLAVIGAYIIKYNNIDNNFIIGFLLIQGANLCFAFGQSIYKFIMESNKTKEIEVFGYFYIGAFIVALISFLYLGDSTSLPSTYTQWLILIYLGIIASGAGYFLWNKGACKVDSGILAIMNNVLIPLAIIVNVMFFGGKINNIMQLLSGITILLISLYMHYKIINYYNRKLLIRL